MAIAHFGFVMGWDTNRGCAFTRVMPLTAAPAVWPRCRRADRALWLAGGSKVAARRLRRSFPSKVPSGLSHVRMCRLPCVS